MTIAELHGKISSAGTNLHDKLEDLLTSDVFTACRYVRPETLLLRFLGQAESLDQRKLRHALPDHVVRVTYDFWPRLARMEPDVLLSLADYQGKYTLVLVEAKYMSGKSGAAADEEGLDEATAPLDQIASEYGDLLRCHQLLHLPEERIRSRHLLYITAHRLMPVEHLEASIREIEKFHPQNGTAAELYWATWFSLVPILNARWPMEEWERPILGDLHDLMLRKRFVSFGGMDGLLPVIRIEQSVVYHSRTASRETHYEFLVRRVPPIGHFRFLRRGDTQATYSWPRVRPKSVSLYS